MGPELARCIHFFKYNYLDIAFFWNYISISLHVFFSPSTTINTDNRTYWTNNKKTRTLYLGNNRAQKKTQSKPLPLADSATALQACGPALPPPPLSSVAPMPTLTFALSKGANRMEGL
jgi:hypothetical protein